jgi:hypothetical protein
LRWFAHRSNHSLPPRRGRPRMPGRFLSRRLRNSDDVGRGGGAPTHVTREDVSREGFRRKRADSTKNQPQFRPKVYCAPQTLTVMGSRAADARRPSACRCGRDKSGTFSAAGRHVSRLPPWPRSSRAMLDVSAHRRDNVSQWLLASQNFRAFLFNQIIGSCSGLAELAAEGVRTLTTLPAICRAGQPRCPNTMDGSRSCPSIAI